MIKKKKDQANCNLKHIHLIPSTYIIIMIITSIDLVQPGQGFQRDTTTQHQDINVFKQLHSSSNFWGFLYADTRQFQL